jgi:hypothetical protein
MLPACKAGIPVLKIDGFKILPALLLSWSCVNAPQTLRGIIFF